MERYNPFAGSSPSSIEDPAPFSTSFSNSSANNNNSEPQPATPSKIKDSASQSPSLSRVSSKEARQKSIDGDARTTKKPDYTTSFPDPLGDVLLASEATEAAKLAAERHQQQQRDSRPSMGRNSTGSSSHSIDEPASNRQLSKQDSPARALPAGLGSAGGRNATTRASGGGGSSTNSSGFSSFLSRATSVTSGSNISDRVSGAMGGMLNAVDSLSSQIQQVVPSNLNLNERFTSTATNLIGGGSSQAPSTQTISRQRVILIIDDPTRTDWLAKFSQYNKFLISNQQQDSQLAGSGGGSDSTPSGQSMLSSFLNTSSSLLSYSTAPFSSSSQSQQANNQIPSIEFCGDLIVQADYRDISVLANQSTGLATVCIMPNRQNNNDSYNHHSLLSLDGGKKQQSTVAASGAASQAARGNVNCVSPSSVAASGQSSSMTQLNSVGLATNYNNNNLYRLINYKTIRPEYVVVRQRARKLLAGTEPDKDFATGLLAQIVKAFDYCAIPMFEEPDLWQIFQDRQLIFTRLLRIQRVLGRENFPLIPQVFCQTHHDLINYIQSSSANIPFPCNVILGNSSTSNTSCFLIEGKIRVDSVDMLRQFASIMVSSGLTCTIEPFLDVKCELIIQKLGSTLKLYKTTLKQHANIMQALPSPLRSGNRFGSSSSGGGGDTSPSVPGLNGFSGSSEPAGQQRQHAPPKLGLGGRQTSLVGSGTKVLSNLISGSSWESQRRDSSANNPCSCYEKVASEVSSRHKLWLEAISREFEQRLMAFSVNIAITSDDREYVVGLSNCSMDFVGTTADQDEDKRSFAELIISHMNQILPKQGQIPSSPMINNNQNSPLNLINGCGSQSPTIDNNNNNNNNKQSDTSTKHQQGGYRPTGGSFRQQRSARNPGQRAYGQLSNRSQSVTINENADGSSSGDGGSNISGTKLYRDSFSARDNGEYGSRFGFLNRRSSNKSSERGDPTNDMNGLNDSTLSIDPHDTTTSYTAGSSTTTMSVSSTQLNQAIAGVPSSSAQSQSQSNQSLFGQSLFDSTSTAFNSLQRQSLSFFRRLDSRTGQDLIMSSTNTPPQSAKSDRTFQPGDHGLLMSANEELQSGTLDRSSGFKSQSIDSPEATYLRSRPPKPPPPKTSVSLRKTRQSSLASQQHTTRIGGFQPATTTPNSTRQNSLATGNNINKSSEQDDPTICHHQEQAGRNQRVTRQNSALSAFEPFDAELARANRQQSLGDVTDINPQQEAVSSTTTSTINSNSQDKLIQSQSRARKPLSYDSGSITSADSSSTGDTSGAAAAEDTMKNLKKTFASIFGDKQVD